MASLFSSSKVPIAVSVSGNDYILVNQPDATKASGYTTRKIRLGALIVFNGGSFVNPIITTTGAASGDFTTLTVAGQTVATLAAVAALYLTQANAASTYLTQANAASAYLTIVDLASTSDATKGAGGVGFNDALNYPAGTGGAKLKQIVNVKDPQFGALPGSSDAVNKASLQAAITAYAATGATIVVPADISIGHKVADKTTWPNFTGVTKTMTVIDYGPGKSYAGYPTTYDGAQTRTWMFTPQTTVPGQHDGNTSWLRGAWAPNHVISNDMDLTGARLATDNRRALFTTMNLGIATWATGQGTQSGAGFTDEDLSNFVIQKYNAPGDTLGAYAPYLVERKTGRISYGLGANNPLAAHDFGPVNGAESLPTMLVRTVVATADIQVQSTSGSGSRSYLKNVSGETRLGTTSGGDAIKLRQADSFAEFGIGTSYTYHFGFQNSRSSQFVHFINNTSAADGFVQKLQSTTTQAATWSLLEGYANAGADKRIVIAGTGNITNVNNSYGAISDAKLKQDIVSAGSNWADFKAYQFRKYRFKSDPTGPLQLGVVAQEIEKVSPGLVSETQDRDKDGEPTGESTKQVAYSILYMKACVVIQELMARVEALEAKK